MREALRRVCPPKPRLVTDCSGCAYYQLTEFQLTEFQLTEFQLTEFQLTEFQLTEFQLTEFQLTALLPLVRSLLTATPVLALCVVLV